MDQTALCVLHTDKPAYRHRCRELGACVLGAVLTLAKNILVTVVIFCLLEKAPGFYASSSKKSKQVFASAFAPMEEVRGLSLVHVGAPIGCLLSGCLALSLCACLMQSSHANCLELQKKVLYKMQQMKLSQFL